MPFKLTSGKSNWTQFGGYFDIEWKSKGVSEFVLFSALPTLV